MMPASGASMKLLKKIFLIKHDVYVTPLGYHPNAIHFNFLQSAVITLWIFEFIYHERHYSLYVTYRYVPLLLELNILLCI